MSTRPLPALRGRITRRLGFDPPAPREVPNPLAGRTQQFIRGADLPDVALRSASGPATLRGYCSAKKPVVVYLSSPRCPFCAQVDPQIASLAVRRGDVRFIKLVVDPRADSVGRGPRNMELVSGLPSAIAAAFRVNVVPAVIATDRQCRIRAAGAGLNGSRTVLTEEVERGR